jgi:hypothetical protein
MDVSLLRVDCLYDSIVRGNGVEGEEGLWRREVPLLVAGIGAFQTVPHAAAGLAGHHHVASGGGGGSFVREAWDTVRHGPVLRKRRFLAHEV